MKGKSLKFFISFYSADAQVKLRILETYWVFIKNKVKLKNKY